MSRLYQILVAVAGASAIVLTSWNRAEAQFSGYHSGAVALGPIDAAALGDTLLASVGLYSGNEFVAAGGIGAVGGALRGYAGGYAVNRGTRIIVGSSYARTLATRHFAGAFHGSIGVELRGGFRHTEYAPRDAGALRLTAPIGVTLGDPSGPSLGLYAAPYAESGVMRRWLFSSSCTVRCDIMLSDVGLENVAGVGAGFRLSLGRLAVELMVSDVSLRRRSYSGNDGAIGFTYRLGR